MKILQQVSRRPILPTNSFANHHHFPSKSLQLSASAKPYVANLDDRFIPRNVFPVTTVGKIVLVAAVVVAVALAQNLMTESFAEILHSQKKYLTHQRTIITRWILKYFKRFTRALYTVFRLLVPTFPESSSEETVQSERSSHSKSSPQNAWKSCSLERKDILNDRFMFYKFKMNGQPSKFGIGRKVVLCTVNDRGVPVKEDFYPTTIQMDRQHFGLVTRIFKRSKDDRLSTLLSSLNYGDEVAFKAGANILEYKGNENPIRYLTIVVSGTGIIPILDMLKRILNINEFQIESCELLWINDSKEDFIFNNEVEKLEAQYPDRFLCARVLDEDITTEESVLNDKVRDSLPLAEPGRVAVIAAPNVVAAKFKPALDSLIYQAQNVMSIPV